MRMRSIGQTVDFLERNNLVMTTAESEIASMVADVPVAPPCSIAASWPVPWRQKIPIGR